jgi:Tol biopolymer transport system component
MTRRLTSGVALFLVLVAASAPAPGQLTTRVSVSSGGIQGELDSYGPALSANGRYAAFHSRSDTLVPGANNGAHDVFLRDRRAGTTILVSVAASGLGSHQGDSYSPVISDDGRFVAYYSYAYNLVAGDTNGVDDVFVYDVLSGLNERVSVDSSGLEGNGRSLYPSISPDGRFVAFHSWADNLVPGDSNGEADVFVHDRSTGVTSLVSVSSAGLQGDGRSTYPTISADGRRIAFESWATNLVANDLNGSPDIFLRDLELGTTTCVSVDPSGVPGNGGCTYSCISDDGRSVAFSSWSSNLVPADTNGLADAFVRDLAFGRTQLISVGPDGVQGNGISQIHTLAAFSRNGRFVVFKSQADNLVPGDTNGAQDVFLRDRWLGKTVRMNVSSDGEEAAGWSSQPSISADGLHVGFYSTAANLVSGDTNGVADTFVHTSH